MFVGRDPRVAKSPGKNCVELLGKHFESAWRQSNSFLQELFSTPVEVNEFELNISSLLEASDYPNRLGHDFRSNSITGNYSDSFHTRTGHKEPARANHAELS